MIRISHRAATGLLVLLLAALACNAPTDVPEPDAPPEAPQAPPDEQPPAAQPPAATLAPPTGPQSSSPGDLLQPADLNYLGAFRLPDWPDYEVGWLWSGQALAYYPEGDPGGPDDGFPGSLFGTGHDYNQYVSEISIPEPVVSVGNLEALNTAETLQPFADVWGGLFDGTYLEIPRTGLAYLPPQGGQSTGKLYFSRAAHLDEGATHATHGWIELDLANPQTAGLWRVGEYLNYVTGDNMFPIPQAWADANAPGMRLATGRYRDGGQGSMGPSLFAIAPWAEGDPPLAGATLPAVPLLLYGSFYDDDPATMDGFAQSDYWSGGAWLTAGGRSAVVFVGTKGLGETWYGCADGTVWPDDPPYPPECPERGWWSERFGRQIVFYDPAQLGAVARGELATGAPQPYAVLEIDDVMFDDQIEFFYDLGAAAFDPERGLLYILEPLVDDEKSVVHVWRVGP